MNINASPVTFLFKSTAVLLSGLFYFLGFSISGGFGWMMWIAPIPVLYIALRVSPGQAFLLSFLAYLIGRLSWFPYLSSVMPLAPAILITMILPLAFAVIVTLARKINLLSSHWFSVLAFPVLYTAFEYLMFTLSADGTMTSIAYTQSNYLPVIQLASLTGILGISFLITFFPAAIVLALFYKNNGQSTTGNILKLLAIVIPVVFIYGGIRINKKYSGKALNVALIAGDESGNNLSSNGDTSKQIIWADRYLQEIVTLAAQGAQTIVLPEKAITVTSATDSLILKKFIALAAEKKVQLIIPGAKNKNDYWLNNAWVISPQGEFLADYQKVNLFAGEKMDNCRPGNKIAVFNTGKQVEGVAICKDMDFQQFILGYSKKGPAILYTPAWDFVIDGWLHARMAILRSVEGGFSLVRNARLGRLTISDWRGKIVAEANSENGKRTTLSGTLFIESHPTVYARAGDWFGTVVSFGSIGFLIFLISKRRRNS